jgi:hypothetical protein
MSESRSNAVPMIILAGLGYMIYRMSIKPERENFFIDDRDPDDYAAALDELDRLEEIKAKKTGEPAKLTRPNYTQEQLAKMKEAPKDLSYAEQYLWDLTHGQMKGANGKVKGAQYW